MATDEDAGKRHVFGPRPVGALVPGLTRPVFRKRAPATAQVLADWEAIVGPALAAVTAPRRLSGATLTVGCAGPVAMELQHSANELMARVNGHLGQVVVERMRFVQDLTLPPPPSLPAPPAPPPDLPGVPPGPLHDALSALGQAVAGASASGRVAAADSCNRENA